MADPTEQTRRFYVSATWDNWPNDGSYADVVEAVDEEAAEEAVKLMMAASRADERGTEDIPDACDNCGNTDQDGSGVCVDCGGTAWSGYVSAESQVYDEMAHEWHIVDCFDLDEFVAQHRGEVGEK